MCFVQNHYKVDICLDCRRFVLRTGVSEFLKVYFSRLPTSCSAHRSPRIPERPFLRKSSAPGSEVARDKCLVLKKKICFFENKFCPRQRSCLGQVTLKIEDLHFLRIWTHRRQRRHLERLKKSKTFNFRGFRPAGGNDTPLKRL